MMAIRTVWWQQHVPHAVWTLKSQFQPQILSPICSRTANFPEFLGPVKHMNPPLLPKARLSPENPIVLCQGAAGRRDVFDEGSPNGGGPSTGVLQGFANWGVL